MRVWIGTGSQDRDFAFGLNFKRVYVQRVVSGSLWWLLALYSFINQILVVDQNFLLTVRAHNDREVGRPGLGDGRLLFLGRKGRPPLVN